MKYIRTKDGRIIDFDSLTEIAKASVSMDAMEKSCAFEIADTIEELCDEFVYVYKNMTPFVSMVSLRGKKLYEYEKDQFLYATKECKKDLIMYGAIWTDKGLIYVAKMNDKGELELL